jgi:hypothetical protein
MVEKLHRGRLAHRGSVTRFILRVKVVIGKWYDPSKAEQHSQFNSYTIQSENLAPFLNRWGCSWYHGLMRPYEILLFPPS